MGLFALVGVALLIEAVVVRSNGTPFIQFAVTELYLFPPIAWMLFAAVCILSAIGLALFDFRRTAWECVVGPAGFCTACGYNLTGNTSGICPECGMRTPSAT